MAETPMYNARVVDGGLQTVVQEYRNSDGRNILMVGCMHVAEPGYFTEVRKIVDKAEASGATVYMEGTGFRDHSDDDASEEERAAMRASREGVVKQYDNIPALLDLSRVYQGNSDLTPYPETWQPSDARELDMIKLVGPQNAVLLSAPKPKEYEHLRRLKESKGANSLQYQIARAKWANIYIYQYTQRHWSTRLIQRAILRTYTTIGRIKRMFTRKPAPRGTGWMYPYIWTYRECVGALRALEDKGDVVMLWHPGHLLGIGRILARNGFEPQQPHEWLTAFHQTKATFTKEPKKRRRTTGEDAAEDKGFTRGDTE